MKRAYQSSSSVPKLFLACLEGDAVEARRFVTASNVNEKFSVSALFVACATGNYDLAKVLIDAGANVSEEPDLLFQVFQSSCDAETELKLVDLLLSSGADVSRKWNNVTPLQAAVSTSGCAETIKLLVQRGADIYDSEGMCVLYWPFDEACRKRDFARIEALLQADVNESELAKWVYMTIHSKHDDEVKERVIKLLVAKGADINFDDEDYTALHIACGYDEETDEFKYRPNPKLVRVLCENGARVDADVWTGCTAVHILCSYHAVYLHKEGEELFRFDSDVIECIKILLQHGAEVDISTKWGETPLHMACGENMMERPRLARFLCSNGARVNAADRDGRTALHTVCGVYSDGEFDFSCFDSEIAEFAKLLLGFGADVDISDRNGSTPLHLACRENMITNPRLVRVLCSNGGASVNVAREDGRTALHILCAANHDASEGEEELARFNRSIVKCVKILLQHGAEVDISDDNGDEPFVLAVASGKHEVVDLLLQHQKEHLPEYHEEFKTCPSMMTSPWCRIT